MSSDGTILKADKDFTKEVDAALPEAEKTAQVRKYEAPYHVIIADSVIEWTDTASHRQAAQLGETDSPSLRSPLYLAHPRFHRHDIEELGRLELAQRAGAATQQEAWTAEAGHHQDGAGGHGILG